MQYVGEIRRFAYQAIPANWLPCDGRVLPLEGYQPLAALIGFMYGGDGETNFALPDLRGRTPVNQNGTAGPVGTASSGSGPEQPYQTVVYAIAVEGTWPQSEVSAR